MDKTSKRQLEVVAICAIETGEIIDHFPVDHDATGFSTFEYYAAEAGLSRCRRNEADAVAVLATVQAPTQGTSPTMFRDQIAVAASLAMVTFGFVRLPTLDAA